MDISVLVKTGKKESKVIKNDFGNYVVWVKSPPVKGLANKELIEVLANYFNTKANNLRIIKGFKIPHKTLRLTK